MAKDKKKPAAKPAASKIGGRPLGCYATAAAMCTVVAAIVAHIWMVSSRIVHMAPGQFAASTCHAADYKPAVRHCTPRQCGRIVLDDFATPEETAALLAIAKRGMAMGGGAGGPTIMDMASGALSRGDKFIDMWVAFNLTGQKPFTRSELAPYKELTDRVAAAAAEHFGATKLWLTAPSFFSRISADRPPKIENDEYWHSHVDKLQYGSFIYTALLYLNERGVDFEGGQLTFDAPSTGGGAPHEQTGATVLARVSPKPGRLVLFSSGHEHPHHVTEVTAGTRFAVTIAFTCDERAALTDFLERAAPDE